MTKPALKVGRPPSANPASRIVNLRLTEAQHKAYRDRGGAIWLKRLIDEEVKREILV